ncbi:RluA family pseudouridine synthase [Parvibium lacunae]|uniref:Pseudouridine synthase n=2 Tax=Parvibium lacunae TaxID=1888893 RepID=A0A368L8I6_9BURK|nr:RluA family pseudouridine synthase [Parvibium lacunae]
MAATGERLDKVVAQLFPQFSRARLLSWLQTGLVEIDGQALSDYSSKIKAKGGSRLTVTPMAAPETAAYVPAPLAPGMLNVIAADAAVIVLDKPAGLVVHPAAGNWQGTLLNGLLHAYPELAEIPRAGIVHRLDKETSGVMVVARTLTAQTELVRQLQARTVKREYRALVWGHVPAAGKITAPMGRDPRDRLKMAAFPATEAGAEPAPGTKTAVTHYQPLAYGLLCDTPVTWVACHLETGRTHQIRVHMQSQGWPLVGDPLYGKPLKTAQSATVVKVPAAMPFARQALHALHLQFIHPGEPHAEGTPPSAYTAPLASDLLTLLSQAGIQPC